MSSYQLPESWMPAFDYLMGLSVAQPHLGSFCTYCLAALNSNEDCLRIVCTSAWAMEHAAERGRLPVPVAKAAMFLATKLIERRVNGTQAAHDEKLEKQLEKEKQSRDDRKPKVSAVAWKKDSVSHIKPGTLAAAKRN